MRGTRVPRPERAFASRPVCWHESGRLGASQTGVALSSISAAGAGRHPVFAALSLCSGVMIFSGQDWIIKLLSGDYPVHQAIAIRGVVAVFILLGFIAYSG